MSDADRIFLETTRRFAPPRLARDDVRIALELSHASPEKAVADLGCGYGRHLEVLAERGYAQALGIDRSRLLLEEARARAPHARLLRANLRSLPLQAGVLRAAFCFYSSMFLGSHDDARQALSEAARVLCPGGSLVLTQDNPLRLALRPSASFAEDVPGLGRVVEESRFEGSVDRVTKRLEAAGKPVLSATFVIRYYLPSELAALALSAGLVLKRLEPDAALTEETPQLIALLEKQ